MRSSHSNGNPTSEPQATTRPRLLDVLRARMRRLGLSPRTEEAYAGWERRFILANDKRHPREMGHADVSTTQIHTHVLERDAHGAISPLDRTPDRHGMRGSGCDG